MTKQIVNSKFLNSKFLNSKLLLTLRTENYFKSIKTN